MLEVNGVTKRFGNLAALRGLSFTARPGAITGFLGPNGVGKTTAMRIIMGIERVDTGFVRWNGLPITDHARRRIGYLPEERGLYPRMKVEEQLLFFARLRGLDSTQSSQAVSRWARHLNLTKVLSRRTDSLSLGVQQRMQLAVALVHSPDLLLLDEPFSGVDPMGVDLMADALRSVAADGASVVFSSHQLDLVEHLCDDVTIINAGRAVIRGSVRKLKSHGPKRLFIETFPTVTPERLSSEPGLIIESTRENGIVVQVNSHFDAKHFLNSIVADHEVLQYRELQPSLEELFRAAVAAEFDEDLERTLPGATKRRGLENVGTIRKASGWDAVGAQQTQRTQGNQGNQGNQQDQGNQRNQRNQQNQGNQQAPLLQKTPLVRRSQPNQVGDNQFANQSDLRRDKQV